MARTLQSTVRVRTFLMVLTSDHITGATGKTVTVTISKNGAAFAAPAGSVAEISDGLYKITLTAADTDTLGDLAFHCTATDCDPTDFTDEIYSLGTSSESISFSHAAASICSAALVMLGGQTIDDLEEDSDLARRARVLYPIVRGFVLSAHPWHCAVKRIELNPDTVAEGDEDWDWAYRFTLPSDFLRIHRLGERGQRVRYTIESGKLLCDESTLKLRYVWHNTNESSWTELLVMAMTQAMRSVLAYPQSSDKNLQILVDAAIGPILRLARGVDTSDLPPDMVGDYTLLNSRMTGGSTW